MNNSTIALIGDPNSGKTTLFNALTGSDQRIGNWPGVTVEKKEGQMPVGDHNIHVIDLPGTYTLELSASEGLDEKIAVDYVKSMKDGLLVNVVDASNLERHLYLTVQLLELKRPMIVVLTMNDRIKSGCLDILALEKLLGVPVLQVEAHKNKKLEPLKQLCTQTLPKTNAISIDYPKSLDEAMDDADILIADARYGFVREVCQKVIKQKSQDINQPQKNKIDKFVLNRFLGLPVFLAVMYLLFLFSINIGGLFQDFFDGVSNTLFVGGVAHVLNLMHLPDFIIAIVAYGMGRGLNTVLTFVPVIASMFFFLSFLEGTGYMARAAFVIDRLMRAIGLPGKAFVPLIIGFGCNVPSVMATRTLDNEKDRIMACIMSPFMLCSARLAIFTVFVSIFFPIGGHNVIFCLYVIGIIIAVFTGYFLKNTLLDKDLSPLLMELPAYNVPGFKSLARQTWSRLKYFLIRAGKVIIPVCTLLGVLNTLSFHDGSFVLGSSSDSVLSWFGKLLTPIFYPIGIEQENWPATVGLLMGTLAKEVVIGTLNTLYSNFSELKQVTTESFNLWEGLHQALLTIPDKFSALSQAIFNPLLAAAPEQALDNNVSEVLSSKFGSTASAFSYLIFVLLYVPCISTMAAIKKELNAFWMYFSLIWSTGVAYLSAVACYQFLTIEQHYGQSLTFFILFTALFFVMRFTVKNQLSKYFNLSSRA